MAGIIRMKTMMVAVMDIGPSMRNSSVETKSNDFGVSKLSLAKNFFACHIVQRMMAVKTAEFCLLLNGDDYTNNHLNTSQGGYNRVNELFPMRKAGSDLIETVHGVTCGSAPGDTIDGIVVGFDVLEKSNVGKAYNKIMLLITDGETEIEGHEDLDPIKDNMLLKECAVYVLFLGKITESSSSTKIQNSVILKEMASVTGGRFREANNLADCFSLLASAPGLCTNPRQSKYVLEISPYMRVPCVIWNKTKAISMPSLKKAPLPSADVAYDPTSTVKSDVTYRNPADDDEEVSMGDRIRGYKYGAQFIPIQEDEERAFKVPGDQGIVLIGFVASSAVPRHHFMGKSIVLEGNPEISSALDTIRALNSAMRTSDKVALVRFVSKQDSDPYLGVLLPNIAEKDSGSSFILHRLPVAEDIREYAFPSFAASASHSEQRKALSQFVDKMSLLSPLPTQLHPFNPTKIEILGELQKRYLSGGEVQFEVPSFVEPLTPIIVDGYTECLRNLCSKFPLKMFVGGVTKKRLFWSDIQITSGDTDENGSKKSKGNGESIASAGSEGLNTKTPGDKKREERARMYSALISAASSAAQQFTTGSVNPVDEFNCVMSALSALHLENVKEKINSSDGIQSERSSSSSSSSGDNDSNNNNVDQSESERLNAARRQIAELAMSTMTSVVEQLVTAGGSPAYHRKAIACLETLREAAIKEGVCEPFNTFLKEIVKDSYRNIPRCVPFWNMVVAKNITLVSRLESQESEVDSETASKFLVEEEIVVEKEVVKEVVVEDDDMFGEME